MMLCDVKVSLIKTYPERIITLKLFCALDLEVVVTFFSIIMLL